MKICAETTSQLTIRLGSEEQAHPVGQAGWADNPSASG